MARISSTLSNPVNYLYFDGTQFIDLYYLFEPQTTNPGSSYTITNYFVNNYTPLWTNIAGTYDLGQFFLNTAYNLFTISGGSYSISSTTTGSTTYNIIITPGTTTLKFNILPNSSFVNFQLIGGGGGGNSLINNFIVDTNNYTISVGTLWFVW